ncbi:MAG: FKBP-type peptidyl-prolyl cis-trans isomerase [Rikenellaceae bacterium]
MKKLFFALSVVALSTFASCSSSIGTNPSVKTAKDSLSYAIGVNFGQTIKQSGIPMEDLDFNVLASAIMTIAEGNESALTDTQLQEVFTNYFQVVLPAKQEEKSTAEFAKVLKENPKAVKDEQVGIVYEISAEGDLTQKPELNDTVMIHYTGMLFDGTVFDSSVERGEAVRFAPLKNTIPGFNAAAKMIGPGGKIKVWIPSALAYGPSGSGPIPPSSNLIFEIEVISVEKAQE